MVQAYNIYDSLFVQYLQTRDFTSVTNRHPEMPFVQKQQLRKIKKHPSFRQRCFFSLNKKFSRASKSIYLFNNKRASWCQKKAYQHLKSWSPWILPGGELLLSGSANKKSVTSSVMLMSALWHGWLMVPKISFLNPFPLSLRTKNVNSLKKTLNGHGRWLSLPVPDSKGEA